MKHMLLGFALLFPFQVFAADKNSVYAWGDWAEGIKPAAGPVAVITPAPANQPKVNFRPNENSAFNREIVLPPQANAPFVSVSPPGNPSTNTPGSRFSR